MHLWISHLAAEETVTPFTLTVAAVRNVMNDSTILKLMVKALMCVFYIHNHTGYAHLR